MAAAASPRIRTASTSAMETARGTHAFKIAGYSLHRGLGVTKFVDSSTFKVGGYGWRIRFYPNGSKAHPDHVEIFLELMNTEVEVTASYEFRLLDQATGQFVVVISQATPLVFSSSKAGTGSLKLNAKTRTELEASAFLRDDCLVIECDVTVINKPRTVETAISPGFEVPPSNPSENLRNLLSEKKGADVAFKVGDEVFPAHKIMLAARSPVFDAELFGPMAEDTTGQRRIAVEDMEPDVFRALLHFMYTDTMPGELDDGGKQEMARHLLVAADRYAMERLKVMCEAVLCESPNIDNVATMLALADRHHCRALGDACAVFIASSNRNKMGDVVASQGYLHLKRACPAVLGDFLERVVTKCLQRRCKN